MVVGGLQVKFGLNLLLFHFLHFFLEGKKTCMGWHRFLSTPSMYLTIGVTLTMEFKCKMTILYVGMQYSMTPDNTMHNCQYKYNLHRVQAPFPHQSKAIQ